MKTSARNRLLATFAFAAAAILVFTCSLGPAIGAEGAADDPWAGFDLPADGAAETTEAVETTEAIEATEPVAEPGDTVITQEPAGEEPTASIEEPVAEEPAAEEPVAEEPATDTVAEEPVAVEPTAEGGVVAGQPAAEEPAGGEPRAMPEPVDPATIVSDPMPDGPMLRFNFTDYPWEDTLKWFAEKANLSYTADFAPPGTFNYIDSREYTPAQAIDLLNSVLLTKGYTLWRRDKMLNLAPVNQVPRELLPVTPLSELDDKGEFEMLTVLFQLQSISPDDAQDEIQGLIGPQGAIVPLQRSGMLKVTEMGGKLRDIRDVLSRIESQTLRVFTPKFLSPAEALEGLRPLLDVEEGAFASRDGFVRIAVDGSGRRLLVSGRTDKINLVDRYLAELDVEADTEADAGRPAPVLQVYPIVHSDPESVNAVLQTLLVGEPDVRLATDPKTGAQVVLASQKLHDTVVRPTIEKYEGPGAQGMRVYYLNHLDPVSVVVSIERRYGPPDENPSAPTTESDSTNRRVIVYGTPDQLDEIEGMLVQMGEPKDTLYRDATITNPNMRILSLDAQSVQAALQSKDLWWNRPNPIRVVMPSRTQSLLRPARPEASEEPAASVPGPAAQQSRPAAPRAASLGGGARFHLAGQTQEVTDEPAVAPAAEPAESAPTGPPASILVMGLQSGGVMIMSDDTAALDEFEQMLRLMAPPVDGTGTGLPTVFFLKYAKAAGVAQTLNSILGGDGSTSGGGTAGLTSALMGGDTMGLIDAVLGGASSSGGALVSGTVRIVPETRLNALIVQANNSDMNLISQMLEILDRSEPFEPVEAFTQSRIVPVINTAASTIAANVLEIYRDRLTGNAAAGGAVNAGGNAMQGLQQLAQMAGGGGRGGRGNTRGGTRGGMNVVAEVQTLALTVLEPTNSIVVAAPEPLLTEVEGVIRMLDRDVAVSSTNRVVVVPANGQNPNTLQTALGALGGDMVIFSASGTTGGVTNRAAATRTTANAAVRATTGARNTNAARGGAATARGGAATARGGAATARGGAAGGRGGAGGGFGGGGGGAGF